MRRRKAHTLQRLANPADESRQAHSRRLIVKFVFCPLVQPQNIQHLLSRRVFQQRGPLTAVLQGRAQSGQPSRQWPRRLKAVAHGLNLQTQWLVWRRRLPVAHPFTPQPGLKHRYLRGIERRGVFEPIQYLVSAGVPEATAQQRH